MPAVRKLRDDRGRKSEWRTPPARIVSLVPSDTFTLVRLGVGARLVGRTRYCVAPSEDVAAIPVVGGTKDADVDAILALAPDAVIANQEENTRGDIERLEGEGVHVFVSFPKTVAAGLAHVARLALLCGVDGEPAVKELVARGYHALRAAKATAARLRPVRTFLPIWMDPLMTVHGDTFISDVLALVGARNVFAERARRYPLAADLGAAPPLSPERVGDRDTRYPRVTLEEVAQHAPELVLLPDEPHPFTEADAAVFRALPIPAATRGAVHFCDGKDLMWYGARTIEGLARLSAMIDAARAPEGSA